MTHTAKHTPGPWVVTQHSAGMICVAGPDCKDLCAVGYNRTDGRDDAANAALIAAAPAMYEALKHLVKVEELRLQATTENDYVDLVIADKHLQELAKAALAKAEGQQL